jgi:hypothetical protein
MSPSEKSNKKNEEDEGSNDIVVPPTFTDDVLQKPAEYGVLKLLEGTWVNHIPTGGNKEGAGFGLHTTCLPSPGTNSETIPGKFHFLCENYTEELTFTLVPGGVRNRGGANEQMIGAVKYNQSIKNEKGTPIHEENGMYLSLNNMYNHPASKESIETDIGFPEISVGDGSKGPIFVPSHTLSRSGTIPHGSSIQLLGSDSGVKQGKPNFPEGTAAWDFDHLAISPTMGGAGTTDEDPIDLDKERPKWVLNESLPTNDPGGNKTYTQRILAHALYPYSVRPDLRLRDTIKDQNIEEHITITMGTEFDAGQGPQGGILNTPMIQKFTPIKKMSHTMWIETVIEDGKKIQQLQYEQVMFFAFQFGSTGGTTVWPHIQVNTLRKKD